MSEVPTICPPTASSSPTTPGTSPAPSTTTSPRRSVSPRTEVSRSVDRSHLGCRGQLVYGQRSVIQGVEVSQSMERGHSDLSVCQITEVIQSGTRDDQSVSGQKSVSQRTIRGQPIRVRGQLLHRQRSVSQGHG